jgi:hypothetical protein
LKELNGKFFLDILDKNPELLCNNVKKIAIETHPFYPDLRKGGGWARLETHGEIYKIIKGY